MKESRPAFEASLAALFDGCATIEQHASIVNLLRCEPELRSEYVRQMRIDALLQFSMGRQAAAGAAQSTPNTPGDSPPPANADARRIGSEFPLTTADPEWFIQEVPLNNVPPRQLLATSRPGRDLPQLGHLSLQCSRSEHRGLKWGLAAALFAALLSLVGWGLNWPRHPAAAKLIAIAQPRWQGAEQMALGRSLSADKPMRLESGALEFQFPGAATVIICGPAEFQVIDGGRLRLTTGELTAHVPPRATGFVVEAAGLIITDLGTEFALSAQSGGRTQVTVLAGSVEVEAPAGASGQAQRLMLAAGESVRRETFESRLVLAPTPLAETLPRDIFAVRAPLALHGSGVGFQAGESDPAWRITSIPDAANFVAEPAIVTAVLTGVYKPDYLPNGPRRAQWLSRSSNLPNSTFGVYVEGDYVFEYTFEIESVDPNSVVVRARVAVDDELREVRLNGQENRLPKPLGGRDHESELVFDHGFVAGRNRFEFVVRNYGLRNLMALRVALEGSGCLTAQRLGD